MIPKNKVKKKKKHLAVRKRGWWQIRWKKISWATVSPEIQLVLVCIPQLHFSHSSIGHLLTSRGDCHYQPPIQRKPAGEGNGTPLPYSCLENPTDGGAWKAAVHGVAKSLTRLSDFTFTFHFHALEKEMATHSSVLAWRIPGTEKPGGLPSMGSHRVRHDWSDLT